MTYRVIALDLDGTLLTSNKQILPESKAVLTQAMQAGVTVLVVTGRHHVAIRPFYHALALDTPAICCNGAYLYDYPKSQVIDSDPLSKTQSRQLIQLMQQHQINGYMYVDDAMLYQTMTESVQRTFGWSETLPPAWRPTILKVESLNVMVDEVRHIWKFAVTERDTSRLQHFIQTVENELGLACEWSWKDQVDIAQTGNSKGKRLQQWVASQGLSMQQVIAFGDNYNDISMLSAVGLGVAMGNADDEVKAHARMVAGDNEHPSIAKVIRTHVLGEK